MSDNELDDKLKQLGPTDMDQLHAERVRRRAQAVLATERQLLGRPWRRQAERAWWKAEPVLLAAFCVAYLAWAFDAASRLYR